MDIVVASTEADLAAVEAIKDHHAAMAGALGARVSAVQRAVRSGQGVTAARDAVVAWAREELLPHAAAEEQTIYAAAGERTEGRLLVEALVADHRVITRLVDRVANADDATVLREHHVVQSKALRTREPVRLLHFASSRSVLR